MNNTNPNAQSNHKNEARPPATTLGVDDCGQHTNGVFLQECFIQTVKTGGLSDVQSLLDTGTKIDGVGLDGQTALMAAAAGGRWSCVALLLESGASVHAKNLAGQTALWCAVLGQSNATCVKKLLEFGSDLECVDAYGMTPLACCVRQYLCAVQIDPKNVSHHTLSKVTRRLECIEALLEAGACVSVRAGGNSKNDGMSVGESILYHAQHFGNEAVGHRIEQLCRAQMDQRALTEQVGEAGAGPRRKVVL